LSVILSPKVYSWISPWFSIFGDEIWLECYATSINNYRNNFQHNKFLEWCLLMKKYLNADFIDSTDHVENEHNRK